MKIHYIYDRIAHHSNHSGYDQLIKYVLSKRIVKNSIFYLLDLLPERILAQIRRSAGEWYNSNALKWELQNIFSYLFKNNNIFHFLYGEDIFHYSGYFNLRKSNKIVVTYHHPPEKFDRIITNKNHLKRIDAVIAVSSQQVDYFSHWVEGDKIHLIPHGIDVDYFHPIKMDKKSTGKKCLFVGTHLRDFETLKRTIGKVNSTNNNIHFTMVTDSRHFDRLSGLENTQLLEKISEDALLTLYREADVLLLPITDCTANNTLLEAMACGLPVITNDVGGVRDYANNQCAIFVEPGNADLMTTKLIKLLDDDVRRKEMSSEARKKALQFDWKIVASKMKEIYKSLF